MPCSERRKPLGATKKATSHKAIKPKAITFPLQNMDIEAACRALEAEIAAMREALPRDSQPAAGSGAAGEQAAAAAQEQQQQGAQPNGVGEAAEGMQD